VAVDDSHVYWTDGTERAIFKAPKAGGGPVTAVATQQDDCRWLATDTVAVYWTCYFGGHVRRLAK
jgi:hypothetical protein